MAEWERRKEIKMFLGEQKHSNSERAQNKEATVFLLSTKAEALSTLLYVLVGRFSIRSRGMINRVFWVFKVDISLIIAKINLFMALMNRCSSTRKALESCAL
ncbi:hypothetical protein LAY57_19240 [Argonema antarcticum A004/B2]|nr:hypothetical protein [Argonema antarcticum A004/B2]